MTNELEKQFFDTFGIKARYYYKCKIQDTLVPEDEFILSYCSQSEVIGFCTDKKYYNSCRVIKIYKEYPQITDRILLELICIANKAYIDVEGTDIETMKNSLLENFIFFRRDVYDQVRTLFEEG